MILLDTSVLSAVLRRRRPGQAEKALADSVRGLLSGGAQLFTVDPDLARIAEHVPLRLFEP